MVAGRHWYFVLSFILSLLAVVFCILVYQSGQYPGLQVGARYLSGIPNYYFFVAIVLPFIAAGVTYLAVENGNIRFIGDLSDELDSVTRARILRFRKILLLFALIFSVLVTIQDAAEKTTALPPYSIELEATKIAEVAQFFACQKEWVKAPAVDCEVRLAPDKQREKYLEVLRENGFEGNSISGFESFDHWREQSSSRYKLESFLSFLAALIVSLLFVQIFLLMMAKQYVKPATKSLVIWLVVLTSLWFPTKMISSRQSNLGPDSIPTILFFGAILLLIGILLIAFLKMERNDLFKFASIVTAVFSALVTTLGYLEPDLIDRAVTEIYAAGWIYPSIVGLILVFSLYLVTDHFLSNYEREASGET